MFIGHWAPAFVVAASCRRAPGLGVAFVAAQLVDWAFFAFVLLGVEHMRITPGITRMNPLDLYHIPYTHSLLATAAWAAGFATVIWTITRDRWTAFLAAVVVASHWFLDLLVHRPDLTLAGGDTRLGLGLWNLPWVEIPLELGLTFGAYAYYLARTRGPIVPPVALGVMLAALQAFDWLAPDPQSLSPVLPVSALAAFAIATALAFWTGRSRRFVRAAGLAGGAPRR